MSLDVRGDRDITPHVSFLNNGAASQATPASDEATAPRYPVPTHWERELRARVHADRVTVFNLLTGVELWPALFRHIRSARVLRRAGQRRLIAIWSSWHGVPLGCRAILTTDPERWQMSVRHVSGLTRGSTATWTVALTDDPNGPVELCVHQQVVVPVPVVGNLMARTLMGGRIALDLGQSMLDRLKEIAEGGSLAGRY